MNKRLSIIALAAAVAISLSACGKAPKSGSASVSEPPPSSSSVPVPPPYIKGTVDNVGYRSDFWNIKVDVKDNVTMATAGEIQELMRLGSKVLGTDEDTMNKATEAVNSAYEAMAVDGKTGSTLAILSQALPEGESNVEEILKQIADGVAKATGGKGVLTLENEGKAVTEKLGGEDFQKISATYKGEGIPDTYQAQYARIKDGRVLIIVTGYSDAIDGGKETMESLLASIKPADEKSDGETVSRSDSKADSK